MNTVLEIFLERYFYNLMGGVPTKQQHPLRNQQSQPNFRPQQSAIIINSLGLPHQPVPPSLVFPNQPLMRQPPQPKQTLVINNDVSVRDVRLVGSKIELTADTLAPANINVCSQAVESYNPINLLTIGFNTFSKKDSARLDEPKLGFKFITKDIVTRDNARVSQERQWPVVVQIDSQQMGMIYYYDIEWQGQGQGKLKLVQQKYQSNTYGAFMVYEIYGIQDSGLTDKQMHESFSEQCVVCQSLVVDTIIMPCRHMCICNECAMLIKQKKDEYDQQMIRQQMQQQQQRQIHCNPNACPVCRKDIESFIRLKKIG